ncbi:toxic anion resistance family protein [Campylobacter sp. MIT 12-8780]|uniref:toxic anion resistance protein n=1 Tax=unclassified Campylobacter TaxID=2593542 RepID=UPI00115F7602|nr:MULTISPECIES: toxic anion resistance protein [unclassified Campylobacter]NDJ26495.1 toxic anion resistance family protein [Campylobacter sp. MIT 19-121]TQR43067.1 toxic anion resistance family protein [Campylobacter sp. MIT 12-8780]
MSNALIQSLDTALNEKKLTRDIIDEFDQEEKRLSNALCENIKGNVAHFEQSDSFIFDALSKIKENIDAINPHNFKLSFFDKIFGKQSQKFKRYFEKFNSNKSFLDQLLNKLEEGKQILLRDNIALELEAQKNADLSKLLQEKLALVKEADVYAQNKLLELENELKTEFEKQILFILKQKIIDLSQQIAVHTQGELAIKTLINNNKELINAVERTKAVTLNALSVAIITSQGLEQQKRVLEAVQGINEQTSDLIAHNAKELKEQAKAIQEGASEAVLDMDKLKVAFDDVLEALKSTQEYKLNALPKMRENIKIFDDYLAKMMSFNKA